MSNNLVFDSLNYFSAEDQAFLDSFLQDNSGFPIVGQQAATVFELTGTTQSFESMSAFVDSPFGQNWD